MELAIGGSLFYLRPHHYYGNEQDGLSDTVGDTVPMTLDTLCFTLVLGRRIGS